MHRTTLIALAVAATATSLFAQTNNRGPGYNGALTDIGSATYKGRRGAAYPNGEIAVAFSNQLCNPGTIPLEWRTSTNTPMGTDHPTFAFLVARDQGGRLVQISDRSFLKHGFYALANPSTCGGACQPPAVAGTQLGVNCSDVYQQSHNSDRNYLAPPDEVNPFTAVWTGTGSYFDVGDPAQANYPQPADNNRSLNTAGFDSVKNRVVLHESDIPSGSTIYFQLQTFHAGERIDNRGDNIMTRPFRLTYGTSWTAATLGTAAYGSILNQWAGATVTTGSNGGTNTYVDDDGRFNVAVKVTGPQNGFWHYEYIVQNLDNSRGGASFRVPVCPTARVQNLGFRDIDQDSLNDWTTSVSGGEIAWLATANNPQNYNTLYNFWFDCDAAPVSGDSHIDQARPGAGSLAVTVPTTAPLLQPAVWLGAGCGTPSVDLFVNGVPSAGNAGFALDFTTAPNTFALAFFSPNTGSSLLAPGCELFLDTSSLVNVGVLTANGAGAGSLPIVIPPGQSPLDLTFQLAQLIPNGPVFNLLGLSNGLHLRIAPTGCN